MMLAAPMNALILSRLTNGPMRLTELRQEAGSPALTTLRAQLKRMVDLGTIAKYRRNSFPGTLEFELTKAGRDLLFVAGVLESWLMLPPTGPISIGDNAARAATNALAEGWSTAMLRALAAAPLSLTELDVIIGSLSYPSLERRLAAMRLAGQVEAHPGKGRGTPYAVTEWLRRGVAPLAAAARWERCHRAPETPKFSRLDAETTFLLTVPLLQLPTRVSGTYRLAMEATGEGGQRLAGVTVEVERGEILSCTTQLERNAGAWALGPPAAWLSAVVENDVDRLELGGDGSLARTMLTQLHRTLFTSISTDVRAAP